MISRPARLVVQGLALSGVVAGSVAFAGFDKSVDLVVDGKPRTVHAFGDTVGDVLRSEGLVVNEHDIVSPSPSSRVSDGTDVVVRYGRQLTVTLDGEQHGYWTTALSVDEALQQLGLRADSARLSVSRSLPLGRRGLALAMDTQKQVALRVGGKASTTTTYATTVGELLDQLNLTVGELDTLSVPRDRPLDDQTRVILTRVVEKRSSKTMKVDFAVRSTKSATLDKGETKVTTKGRAGAKRVTYVYVYTDGKRTDRKVVTTVVVKRPRTQTQLVGTRAPKTVSLPSGGGGLNWAALAKCESGGNPRAVNPAGYYGLYQFSLSTWHRVGGAGNPIDASPGEQLKRAQMLYARSGSGQWGCGSHLYD